MHSVLRGREHGRLRSVTHVSVEQQGLSGMSGRCHGNLLDTRRLRDDNDLEQRRLCPLVHIWRFADVYVGLGLRPECRYTERQSFAYFLCGKSAWKVFICLDNPCYVKLFHSTLVKLDKFNFQ